MNKPKLLYISCHEVLEYDELRMFTELGIDVSPIGFYFNPQEPMSNIRPPIPNLNINKDFAYVFMQTNPNYILPGLREICGLVKITKELIESFDIIYICYYPDIILKNDKTLFNDKMVILRTIAVPDEGLESMYAECLNRVPHLKIVRMSNLEKTVSNFCGYDMCITQTVDTNLYSGWHGTEPSVLTVNKYFKERNTDCGFNLYEEVTKSFKRKLIGVGNNDLPYAEDGVSQEQLLEYLKSHRVYFPGYSRPSPITYSFIEALCTGIPIVSMGKELGYEGLEYTNYIENGVSGFYSDDIKELKSCIHTLFVDYNLAIKMSVEARNIGMKYFDWSIAKDKWKRFFKHIGIL